MSLIESGNVVARWSKDSVVEQLGKFLPGMTDEVLLECILEHSAMILWAIDAEGKFILARGAGLREIGMEDDQVVGLSAFELYKDYPDIQQSLIDSLAGKEHHDFVEVNGACFESWYCPMKDSNGNISGVVGISTVVTELAATKQELGDALGQFQQSFQRSPVMMAILKVPGAEFVEVNQAFEKITGHHRADVLGRTIKELGLWQCPFQVRNPDYNYGTMTSFHDEVLSVQTKQGEQKTVIASGAKIRFRGQDCVLLFGRDATEESRARQALKNSELRFATLARQAPVGIFQCNRHGEIQDANEFFWSCFQEDTYHARQAEPAPSKLSDPEAGPIHWYALFKQEGNRSLEQQWTEAVQRQASFSKKLQPLAPYSKLEWGMLQIDPVAEDHFIGTLVDISAIKRAESVSILRRQELEKAVRSRTAELEKLNSQLLEEVEARRQLVEELQLSKEHMHAVVQNAIDTILHINQDERIEFINHVAPGQTLENVIGTKVDDWILPQHREANRKFLRRILDHNETLSHEIPIYMPNQPSVLYSVRGGPIIVNGKTVGASIVARDITRERELERQSKQRLEELSHLSRLSLVGEMSASMSHELKQPLLAIGNYATGCLHRISEGNCNQEQIVSALQAIAGLSHRSCSILRRTRDFLSKSPPELAPVALPQLIRESLEFVQAEVVQHSIQVIENYDPALPSICIDSVQIQQVIVNLLVNAIEAISGSQKTISHEITVRAKFQHKKWISITLEDTADGISGIQEEEVFEAFRTAKKNGLGMGLAISRSIVENHNGTLKLKKSGPEGTVFELTLPVC